MGGHKYFGHFYEKLTPKKNKRIRVQYFLCEPGASCGYADRWKDNVRKPIVVFHKWTALNCYGTYMSLSDAVYSQFRWAEDV